MTNYLRFNVKIEHNLAVILKILTFGLLNICNGCGSITKNKHHVIKGLFMPHILCNKCLRKVYNENTLC